jgi:Family of unknown function (DUF6932)
LPLGIHDCELSEIEKVFVHDNRQRKEIWRGFQALLELVRPISELNVIYIDGGFVTDNAHPNDVDIVIEYPDKATRRRLREDHWFLRQRSKVLDIHLVDVLGCLLNEPPQSSMVEFFQFLRIDDAIKRGLPAGARKGILKITLQ